MFNNSHTGSYNENKYNNGNYNNFDNGNNHHSNNDGYNYNGNNAGNTYNDDEDSIVTTNALFRSGTKPAVRNQASVSNQNFRNQGTVDNNYLPPFERSQPINSFSNHGPNGFNQVNNNQNQATRNQNYQRGNEVQKAYLPPFERNGQQGSHGPAYNGQNRRFGNQGPTNGVTNAYLPPSNQRSPSFGRRQSGFNARNGYQY